MHQILDAFLFAISIVAFHNIIGAPYIASIHLFCGADSFQFSIQSCISYMIVLGTMRTMHDGIEYDQH